MVQMKATPADEERARKKALAVRDSLTRGADFAAMARAYSGDTATRDSGGVLGQISVPTLPANLREPLAGLRVGEVSVPFKREAGYHIFKLLARDPEGEYRVRRDQGRPSPGRVEQENWKKPTSAGTSASARTSTSN